MYRFDGFPDVLHRYSMESSIYDSGMLIPDYDLAEKYQYNGLFSKIIDRPAEEALKHGIEYNISDQTLADFLDDALDRLDWEEKATTAIRWARLFGGAVIVMLLDDGRGLEEPVNWQDIRSVEELRVYERAIVQPDPNCYLTGKAEYFDISSTYGGFFRVHRSRCLVFKNGSLPEYAAPQQYFYWGLPEYVRIRRDLSIALHTHQSAANMIDKSVQPVYKQRGLQSTLAGPDGDDQVLKRLQVLDASRGMLNSVAVDMDGEDYSFQTFQLSGASEILESTYSLLSAVTCIPQTILFGRSPSGENATGESDLENYYNFVEGIQKRMLKKNIRTLLKAVVQAGVYDGSIAEPQTIKPTFKPLWSLSEAEQATVELSKAQRAQATAQTAQLYIDMQVLQPDEVRQALARDGTLNIEDILDHQPQDAQDDGWAQLLEGLETNDNPIPDAAGQLPEQGGIMNPETARDVNAKDGGEGSGNFNHEGRPGKIGGSGGGGSSSKLSSRSMPAKKYVTSDGKMDVDALRKDYDEFTQEMDEGCRTYLKQSMESVEFRASKLPDGAQFGYSPSKDALYYDPSQPSLKDMDLSVVATHELAHRIDSQFVHVAENEDFRQKVSASKQIIDAEPEKFQQFCIENDEEGFLSDICSAVCEGQYDFDYGHSTQYWKLFGNKEKEIFANYYSLVAFRDIQKLDFLQQNLPEVYESCEKMKKQLLGEDD